MKTYEIIYSLVKVSMHSNSEYTNIIMVVCKSLITLIKTLKNESFKNNYRYNNLLMNLQYIKRYISWHQQHKMGENKSVELNLLSA